MENRCQKLARSMPEGFEAALVTTAPNRFYFLDFDADDAGSLLIFPDESVFLIDSRYIEVAEKTVKSAKVVEEHDRLAQIAQLLHRHGVHRLYLEEEITVAEAARVGAAFEGVELGLWRNPLAGNPGAAGHQGAGGAGADPQRAEAD